MKQPVKPNIQGTGVGKGPGRKMNLPVIREVTDPARLELLKLNLLQPGSRAFKMGKADILVSPPYLQQGWHVSVSRPDHYPDWDEVTTAWYSLVPDAVDRLAVMVLPPFKDYVDIHANVFQIHELVSGEVAGFSAGMKPGLHVKHSSGMTGQVLSDGVLWVQVSVDGDREGKLIAWWRKDETERGSA